MELFLTGWQHRVDGHGEPRMPTRDGHSLRALRFLMTGGVLNDHNIDQFLDPETTPGVTTKQWVKDLARYWGWSFAGNDNGDWILIN